MSRAVLPGHMIISSLELLPISKTSLTIGSIESIRHDCGILQHMLLLFRERETGNLLRIQPSPNFTNYHVAARVQNRGTRINRYISKASAKKKNSLSVLHSFKAIYKLFKYQGFEWCLSPGKSENAQSPSTPGHRLARFCVDLAQVNTNMACCLGQTESRGGHEH